MRGGEWLAVMSRGEEINNAAEQRIQCMTGCCSVQYFVPISHNHSPNFSQLQIRWKPVIEAMKIVWDTYSIKSYKSCAHCINVAGQQISGGNIGWISAHFMPWKRGRPSWMLSPSWGALTLHCLNWETSRLVQAICIQLITMSLVGHLAECIGWERRFNRTTYILSINISSKYI